MQQPCKPGPSAIRSILPLSVAVFVWLLLPCNSIISNADGLLTAAFTTSTGDRVQEMFRTWMIAGIALAAPRPGTRPVQYSWMQLEAMNERFRRAMERAIARGKEHLPDAEGRRAEIL